MSTMTYYVHVRRLDLDAPLALLQKEFSLKNTAAASVVDYFDADRNGSLGFPAFLHFNWSQVQKNIRKLVIIYDIP